MRQRSLLEIVIVYILIEAALWTRGHVQVFWIAMAAICVGMMTIRGDRSAAELGLTRPRQGSARMLAIGIAAGIAILVAGWAAGTLHRPQGRHSPVLGFVVYVTFAFVQEFVLQSFFFVRLESLILSGRVAVLAAAALFCLAHLPNPALVLATFFGALFFCEAFRRYRSVYPVWLAHLLLGLAVAAAVPDSVTHQMKVGLAYLTYRESTTEDTEEHKGKALTTKDTKEHEGKSGAVNPALLIAFFFSSFYFSSFCFLFSFVILRVLCGGFCFPLCSSVSSVVKLD